MGEVDMDEIEIVECEEDLEEIVSGLTFRIVNGEILCTDVAWTEDVDFEAFTNLLINAQKGIFLGFILKAIIKFGIKSEDLDFAEMVAERVQTEMDKFLENDPDAPVIRPQVAIPMLLRRGAGGE